MTDSNSNAESTDPPQGCPADDALLEVIVDAGNAASTQDVEHHLDQCEKCRQRLEQLTGTGTVSAQLATATDTDKSSEFEAFKERMQERGALSLAAILNSEDNVTATADGDDFSAILEPPSRPHLIGMLGDYEIEEKVAAGGMGVVFKARDPMLDRTVAIKVLSPTLGAASEGRERFVREARAAAALDHENILPIYHVNHSAKAPFLVMPFIEGQTLEDVMRDRGAPLPPEEIRGIARQIASGLAVAHDRGLIHRDIKPANLLLEPGTDRVRIADFGLARAVWDPALTQSGVITGTPLFMSPEQAGDEPVDARSDLFSLGAVLYYLATAKFPFNGARSLTILRKVRDEEPAAIAELNPNIPDWLTGLIGKLMQKDPADRLQSAEEILAVLDHPEAGLQETSAAAAKPTASIEKTRLRPVSIFMAACGAVAGIAAVAIAVHGSFFQAEKPPSPPDTGSASSPAAETLRATIIRRAGTVEPPTALAEAVRNVRIGDVIELATTNGEAFTTPTIQLNRPVTLRAANGQLPVIESRGTIFETSRALRLEGLVLRSTGSDAAVINTSAGELTITNCRIENATAPAQLPPRARPNWNPVLGEPLIRCTGTDAIQITNSKLVSSSTVLRLQPGKRTTPPGGATRILFGNCVLHSQAGIVLELGDDVELNFRRCLARTNSHLLTLHRKPRANQNGKCVLRAVSNSFASGGPIVAFGGVDIPNSVSATFESNAWINPGIWSAGIFSMRRQNANSNDRSLITRSHGAFLQLLNARENRPQMVKGSVAPNEALESLARRFPDRCGPEINYFGPGKAYHAFRTSALYKRLIEDGMRKR